MKILVTGGNGLVGSALISMLLKRGETVAVFDKVFDSEFIDEEEKAAVEFIQGDLSRFEHVLNAVERCRPEVVYHLGGLLSVPCEQDPATGLRVNACGAYYVLEAARLFQARQVIYCSTLTTYGRDLGGRTVDDFTLQRPTTIYGITKLLAENLGRYYKDRYGLDFRAVRYSALVGPGAKTKHIAVYNAWMIEKSLLGEPYAVFVKPETKTTLTYFKDAAGYLIKLAEAPLANIKTVCYNLPGQPSTARELADCVMRMIPGAQIRFEPEEEIVRIWEKKGNVTYDGARAREEWGWQPAYTMEEMIADFGREMEKLAARRHKKGQALL